MSGARRLVVVTGTGTDVGKTYVTAAAARALLARGIAVHARKPVQSFAPGDTTTDADVLAGATGEPPLAVCPRHRWLETPLAPPMAAEVLGQPPFTIADLAAETLMPASGVTFVEGAGGLRSPLAADGDTLAFIRRLAPDTVVVIAEAALGTINLVRLTADALAPVAPIVFLNRFDPGRELHRRNAEWLRDRDGLDVVTDGETLATRLEPR